MSNIIAKVQDIKKIENLHLISFSCEDTIIKVLDLDISPDIQIGKKAILSFKPSAISLAKDLKGDINISNKLPSKVLNILRGELLSIVTFEFNGFELESLFLSQMLDSMNLKNGENIIALIKESEISIMECINE